MTKKTMSSPLLLMPKLLGPAHVRIRLPHRLQPKRPSAVKGDGTGTGTSYNEELGYDEHPFLRSQKPGDGLGEGEFSYNGTNTHSIWNDGKGYDWSYDEEL